MLLHLLTQLRDRPATGSAPDRSTARLEVCAPAPRAAVSGPLPALLSAWMERRRAGLRWGLAVLPRANRQFIDMLADIDGAQARALQVRIAKATSLRELWHLRTEVFAVVLGQRDAVEAHRRLARLNRHFPHHTASPQTNHSLHAAAVRSERSMAPSRTQHQTPETGR